MTALSLLDFQSLPDYTKNVTTIVFSMLIGVTIAALLSLFYKNVLGSFIRHLLMSKADSPENALKLDGTSFAKNIFILHAIKSNNIYRNVLRYTGGTDIPAASRGTERRRAEKNAVLSRAYYIPEELTFRADNIFSKKGTNIIAAVFGVVLFTLVAAASLVIIPDLMTMAQNFINNL